jgi:hypothetical protein
MAKYKHYFHRSEYQIALDNYRRARRRGDAADAHCWLKTADMHLRVADRFDEGMRAALLRDLTTEKAETQTAERESRRQSRAAQASLDKLMADVDRRFEEEMAAEEEEDS